MIHVWCFASINNTTICTELKIQLCDECRWKEADAVATTAVCDAHSPLYISNVDRWTQRINTYTHTHKRSFVDFAHQDKARGSNCKQHHNLQQNTVATDSVITNFPSWKDRYRARVDMDIFPLLLWVSDGIFFSINFVDCNQKYSVFGTPSHWYVVQKCLNISFITTKLVFRCIAISLQSQNKKK